MQLQKISIFTPKKVIGNSKLTFLKKSIYEAKEEIPGGRGSKPKKHLWGRYGYILEPHNLDSKWINIKFYPASSVSKYGRRIFIDVFEMKESDVVVHSKDQDIQDWSNIALRIKECYENYHGFVILHGTDTMAYLASALSFMFENLGKSVIFTGSQASLIERCNI